MGLSGLNKRMLQPGERIRVLVVDDSVVIRRLVTHALEEDPVLEVVGAASNGAIALERIPQLNPDVLTLDVEMPVMDGIETLRRIRREYPQLRVIMFSTLTERGAAITLEALTLGADDYVAKASNEGSLDRSMTRLRDELIPKIKQFFVLATRVGTVPALRWAAPVFEAAPVAGSQPASPRPVIHLPEADLGRNGDQGEEGQSESAAQRSATRRLARLRSAPEAASPLAN